MAVSLGELAVRFGCELRGNPDTPIERIATLGNAGPGSIAFLANPKYRSQLADTQASAVVLDSRSANACPVPALVSPNPYATFARISTLLNPTPGLPPGIHPSAVVASTAKIDPTAHVGPLVVIGGDGFGFAPENRKWVKIPQIGTVRVGADVEIGSNTTVDRGAIGDTVIEDGVKLDNLVMVAHAARIGEHTVIAGCTGVSGSTTIGKRCVIGGAVGTAGHISIADDVSITGFSMITHSITEPGVYSSGLPFDKNRVWRRTVGHVKRLDNYVSRLKQLERAQGLSQSEGPADHPGEEEND